MVEIKSQRSIVSKIGSCEIEHSVADAAISSGLNRFLENLDFNAGNFFNRKVRVCLSLTEDVEGAKQRFLSGYECLYRGTDMPVEWQLKEYSNGFIFYSPRRSAFIDLKRYDEEVYVKVNAPCFDLNVVRLASIDLMQTLTNQLLVHSIALEKDGKGILLLGESKSGKTTLLAQLINAGYKFNLVSEGHSLVAEGEVIQVKTAGLLRHGALHYLNLNSPGDVDVEFGKYIGTVSSVGKIDYVIVPAFNLNDKYAYEQKQISVKPLYRDWALQACDSATRNALLIEKTKRVEFMPKEGILFRYSTDSMKTAVLFDNVMNVKRC